MTTTDILNRAQALVARKFDGPPALAAESCLRVLRTDKPVAEKWLAVTRALNKVDDPGPVFALLEALGR